MATLQQITSNGTAKFNDIVKSNSVSGCSDNKVRFIPKVPYTLIDPTHNTQIYLQELLKWICSTYPDDYDCIYFGVFAPNSRGIGFIHIYDNSQINSEGYPQYSSGTFFNLGGITIQFGTTSYTFFYSTL